MPTFKPLMDSDLLNRAPISNTSTEESMYLQFISIKQKLTGKQEYAFNMLCDFVSKNIHLLLSSAIDKRPKSLKIITDKDFLLAMSISNITLDTEYLNRFNRVYIAYFKNPEQNVVYNNESASLLYSNALRLNKETVDSIKKLGISENDALWLVVNRYSSTDERRNIRKMVRAMQHMNPNVMTEQMVVDIFTKTFSNQLTNLFCTIMTDKFDPGTFDSESEHWVYSTVSNAILAIMETMSVDDIMDILAIYTDELKKSGIQGRFPLRSISSGDYPKIQNAIDELEQMNIHVR